MARQELNNGESGLVTRTKINQNFTELYGKETFESLSESVLIPDIDTYQFFELTAQDEALTIENPTGTIENFGGIMFRINPTGPHALVLGNKFRPFGSDFQSNFTANKTLYITALYNETDDLFDTVTREEI